MSRSRRFAALVLAVSLLAGLALGLVHWVQAQIIMKARPIGAMKDEAANDPHASALTLPTDRKAQQVMNAAEQLIKEKEWRQVVRALQSLLDIPQDGFVQITRKVPGTEKTITKYVSMKEEANRLLGTMPDEGIQFYEQEYGGFAKVRLADARDKQDAAILAEVDTRYRHTEAGFAASLLLGTRHLHRDEPLMASLYFNRLFRQAGDKLDPWSLYKVALACSRAGDQEGNKEAKETAKEAWKLLSEKVRNKGGIDLAKNQYVSLSTLRTEIDRAGQEEFISVHSWPYFRGGPTRTEQAVGGSPFLEATWSESTLPTKSDVKSWTEENLTFALRHVQDERQQPVLSSFFPIAVNGKVLYRTYDGVYARSLKHEGKLEWFSYTDGGVLGLISDPGKKGYLEQWNGFYRQNGPRGILYENSVIGSLSTDSTRVFVVDDLAIPPHPYVLRNFGAFGPQPNFGSLSDMVARNSLKAYNLETGKLVWERSGKYDTDSELAGSFFLGPPLPLGGKLYLLTEKNSELRLTCLEPKDTAEVPRNPEVAWTQTLALSKDKIQLDINRRIHCAHLAYGNGILVCPTNAGAVLGVNLLSHSLVWAHFYREGSTAVQANPNPFRGFNPNAQAPSLNTEWRVSAPAVAENRVVFTAPDANAIYCLDLADGTQMWRVARAADDLYFAGVFHGKVVIVGKNYVKAYHLHSKSDKGELAWQIDNVGTPSGQGAASGNVYYLPLKIGPEKEPEVCAIDLLQGKVIAHTKSRKKEVPGNLVFFNGEVLSQTLTGIASFPQLQTKLTLIDERIKSNPKDPVGLIERGELRLDRGDLELAYQDLHAALQNNPPADLLPKAREKLYETLTDMFQRDFGGAEKYLTEYSQLCSLDVPSGIEEGKRKEYIEAQRKRRTNFLCLVAKGREKQGRLVDAYDAYMEFGAQNSSQELIDVFGEPGTKSPPAVWARGRIAAMLEKANAQQRQPLEEKLTSQWDKLKEAGDVVALRRFADLFGPTVSVGRLARLRLAECLLETSKDAKADELREAQLLLLQLSVQKAADAPVAGQAIEVLARLMLKKGLMSDAAFYYRELARDFGRTVIKDGKTGADLYNELTTDKRFLPFLEEPRPAWHGSFKVTEIPGSYKVEPTFGLEAAGDPMPFFQRHRLALDMTTNQLRVVDQLTGAEHWKTAALPSLQYLQFGQTIRTVFTARGSVVIINLGHMVYGFDPVDQKKLWEYNLYDPGSNRTPQLGQVLPDRNGNFQLLYQDGWRQNLGQVSAAEASYVCLQTRTGLVALDPLKGPANVLWTRSDVSAGRTQIFGDDQYIYLVELNNDGNVTGASKAVRAADGVTVNVPDFAEAFSHKLTILGRTLLVKDETEKGMSLRLYDVQTGKDLWKKEYPAGTMVLKSDVPELTGTVDPLGNVSVFDLRSRREVLQSSVKKDAADKLQDAHLLADRDQFYVVLNKTLDANLVNNGAVMLNVYHGMRCVPINGTIYAFDRENGKVKWFNAVANQMLVVDQFKELPILLFTSRVQDWVNQGPNRINQPVVKVQTIHKANGKLLYMKTLNHNMGNFHAVQVDPKANVIDLVSFNLKVRHTLEPKDTRSAADNSGGAAPATASK